MGDFLGKYTLGSQAPWNPGTDGEVLSLATHGGVLYLGGLFATVAGQPRSNAAAP